MSWLMDFFNPGNSNQNERKLLTEISVAVKSVSEKMEVLMADVASLSAKLDAIGPVLDAVAADEQAQKDMIQSLKDQIAAGTPVSQAQLDELDAKAGAILARVQGIDASV